MDWNNRDGLNALQHWFVNTVEIHYNAYCVGHGHPPALLTLSNHHRLLWETAATALGWPLDRYKEAVIEYGSETSFRHKEETYDEPLDTVF